MLGSPKNGMCKPSGKLAETPQGKKGSGSHPQLVKESFQEVQFIGEPWKQLWVSEESTIKSALRVGFRGDVIGISAWKTWVVATVAQPEGARGKLKEEWNGRQEQRVWTWHAGTRMERMGSRMGMLPGWRARQMLLADNLMFGCYSIARQVERMGRRLAPWDLTNGMSSFPIWVTVPNLCCLCHWKAGVSQQKGSISGRDGQSTLGLSQDLQISGCGADTCAEDNRKWRQWFSGKSSYWI